MKKTYINPKAEYIQMDLESLIAASPEGFNKELDDDNTITPGDMLSRRRRDIWEDEEDEEDKDNY
jgi:hypothetical protein